MPKYGINFSDEAHEAITRGLEVPSDGGMPNRSERVDRLVLLGALCESELSSWHRDPTGRDISEVRSELGLIIEHGVKRCREFGVID